MKDLFQIFFGILLAPLMLPILILALILRLVVSTAGRRLYWFVADCNRIVISAGVSVFLLYLLMYLFPSIHAWGETPKLALPSF
ncbi:hypothetical protein LPW11_04015 [Geomonas sp. RF6]|uniref:hypothetical protein n=1 Tax=Geomonas sp. RF6 TaxID=2897342 RepID=UPI001E2CACFA|nr:hypothetical protein [Geomonas sp. RF6]UFS71364.1 hypothetical protein LPW11_04015 [Geomonas sp. RF6]